MKTRYLLLTLSLALCVNGHAQQAGRANYGALRFSQPKAYYSYLMRMVHGYNEKRSENLQQALSSKSAAQKYVGNVKQKIREVMGTLPERGDLHAQVTGRVQGPGFYVEKIIFQSEPGRYVTAHLYLPDKHQQPLPACIEMCGHGLTGKGNGSVLAARMALMGIATMVVDPIAQGERLQLIDENGKDLTRGVTTEHTLLNPAFELLGTSMAAQIAFDNSRAIDYLVSRTDIDATRIGAYGFSGGGTECSYLLGIDDRIQASCIGLYFSSRARTLETQGPSDGCQQISGEGSARLEIADFALANAPRPFLVLDGKYDFVDHWGALQAFKEVQKLYKVLDCADRVGQYYAEDGHATPEDVQQQMLSFFGKWLLGNKREIPTLPNGYWRGNDMLCTKSGQVNTEYADAKSTMQMTVSWMDAAKSSRDAFLKGNKKTIIQKIRQLLGIDAFNDQIEAVPTGQSVNRGYREYRYQLNCEGQFPIPVVVWIPDNVKDSSPIEIHLSEKGKAWYLNDYLKQDFVSDGRIIIAADFRGVGETEDPYLYNYTKYWNSDYRSAAVSLHVGKPLIGQRVTDMHTLLNFCQQDKNLRNHRIEVVADGLYGPVMMHAAVLDDRISKAVLTRTIKTWRDYLEHPMQYDMLRNVVPGALQYYDLPDLLRLSQGRVRITD